MFKLDNNTLSAEFKFDNFTQAFAFMTEVAFLAEQHQHHPNWSNVWNTVNIALTTHDAGNTVTDKDYELAKAIELVAARWNK